MNNDVIIIGNGPSLLQKENGVLIDTFKNIIRFNQYIIKGYEKYTGLRTDYWFNTINYTNKEKEFRVNAEYRKIYLHSWQFNPEKDALYISFTDYYKSKNKQIEIEKTKKENTVNEMQQYMNNSYIYYSTGAIAIWLFLKQFNVVNITGFDWWREQKHHYGDNGSRGDLHKPDKEFEFIDKLMKENKIIML
ncbi:MAG: glycosyltransferase family 29 protein [Clostridia bacterium]|nr:glycosyltransferase family 29 protein [Clostridia bacterium]